MTASAALQENNLSRVADAGIQLKFPNGIVKEFCLNDLVLLGSDLKKGLQESVTLLHTGVSIHMHFQNKRHLLFK